MPITPAQFRDALPEFKNAGDGLVQASLDEAYFRTGESWGDARDLGAKWMAAHLVASSVLGEPSAKGKSSDGKTVYLRNWESLQAQVRVPFSGITDVGAPPLVGD